MHALNPQMGSKFLNSFILNEVMLHIKLKVIELIAPCKHIVCPYTHPQHAGCIKSDKIRILNVVMLHITLKGKKYRLT